MISVAQTTAEIRTADEILLALPVAALNFAVRRTDAERLFAAQPPDGNDIVA